MQPRAKRCVQHYVVAGDDGDGTGAEMEADAQSERKDGALEDAEWEPSSMGGSVRGFGGSHAQCVDVHGQEP